MDATQLHTSIDTLCAALCTETFPTYARVALQRLLEQMQQGSVEYKAPVLLILHCVLQVPGVALGDALGGGGTGRPFLLAPVVQLMEVDERNPLGQQVGGCMRWCERESDDCRVCCFVGCVVL